MRALIGVYGAGGCGRGIMPLVRQDFAGVDGAALVFVDDGRSARNINGHEVWDWEQFLSVNAEQRAVCLAVANSSARELLDARCRETGVKVIGARASNVVEMDDVQIGPGALLSPFVTLTSNIRIGRCFHANLYSYVEHDCQIGNYVTFAPGVHCNGNVHIHDHAYIGTGAFLRQGAAGKPLIIGAGAVVGMGAVVTKDVPAGATVVGNPARLLVKD